MRHIKFLWLAINYHKSYLLKASHLVLLNNLYEYCRPLLLTYEYSTVFEYIAVFFFVICLNINFYTVFSVNRIHLRMPTWISSESHFLPSSSDLCGRRCCVGHLALSCSCASCMSCCSLAPRRTSAETQHSKPGTKLERNTQISNHKPPKRECRKPITGVDNILYLHGTVLNSFKHNLFRILAFMEAFMELDSSSDDDTSTTSPSVSLRRGITAENQSRGRMRSELDDIANS